MSTTISLAAPPQKLPFVVPLLAVGTFLMCTTEYIIAGLLPEIAADFDVSLALVGLLIAVFAVGMIIGTPVMAILTLHLPHRLTLVLALLVFAMGHVVAALSCDGRPRLDPARPRRVACGSGTQRSRPA